MLSICYINQYLTKASIGPGLWLYSKHVSSFGNATHLNTPAVVRIGLNSLKLFFINFVFILFFASASPRPGGR